MFNAILGLFLILPAIFCFQIPYCNRRCISQRNALNEEHFESEQGENQDARPRKSFADSKFEGFSVKLNSIEEEESPKFASMKPMALYKLVKDDYPAIGMMYKTEEGLLYGLMVVSPHDGSKSVKIKTSAVDKWLDNIGFEDDREKVRIAVIPRPPLADEFDAEYEGDGTGYPLLELWKVPLDYGRSF